MVKQKDNSDINYYVVQIPQESISGMKWLKSYL